MAGSLIRRLGLPAGSLNFADQVDWSAISGAGVGLVFRALLSDLIGAPPPPELRAERLGATRPAWRQTNVKDTYYHQSVSTTGFLVRGIIFDMNSLIQSRQKSLSSNSSTQNSPEIAHAEERAISARDWTSLVDLDISKEKEKPKEVPTVAASQVMERLGLGVVPGLASRVAAAGGAKPGLGVKASVKNLDIETPQKAEGIRDKYAARIRRKRILADANREAREIGITANPQIRSTGSSKGWKIMPGLPSLLRYFEARGLSQGLLARGQEDDLNSLLDQIGNYRFQHVSRLLVDDGEPPPVKQELSAEILRSICSSWGYPGKQILLVVGENQDGEAMQKQVGDLGFFVCKVKGARFMDYSQVSSQAPPLLARSSHQDNSNSISESTRFETQRAIKALKEDIRKQTGVKTWFKKLATGTLHEGDTQRIVASGGIHFTVADMVELKWVVEDLNGVSYRRSTFIRGFEDIVGR